LTNGCAGSCVIVGTAVFRYKTVYGKCHFIFVRDYSRRGSGVY